MRNFLGFTFASFATVSTSLALAAGPVESPVTSEAGVTGEASDSSSAPSVAHGPIRLIVRGSSDATEVAALREGLSAECDCDVLLGEENSVGEQRIVGEAVVQLSPESREIAVSFSDAARGTVTRVVEHPDSREERIRLLVLLLGNLARAHVSLTTTPVVPTATPALAPAPSPSAPSKEAPEPAAPPRERIANASFFYPLSTNYGEPSLRTNFSLNLVYGRIGALEGIEFGTVNSVENNVDGLEASLIASVVGGAVVGAQGSFGFNAAKSLRGLQLGTVNYLSESAVGLQSGFALNIAGAPSRGAQFSLGLNHASDLEGVQVGSVNIARKVEGAQVGLINVADDVEGVPLGLISVTKSGGIHPLVWYSNNSYVNAGVKFATRYTYTFLHASLHPVDRLSGLGYGLGGSVPIVDRLFFESDVGASYLVPSSGTPDQGQALLRLRGMFRFEIFKHLSPFLGGGAAGKFDAPGVTEPTGVLLPEGWHYETLAEFFAGVQL